MQQKIRPNSNTKLVFKINSDTGNVMVVNSEESIRFLRILTPDKIKLKRVSHVLPVNPFLKSLFRWLRDRYGETGRVSAFTRKWPCKWNADMSPTGQKVVLGPFRARKDAIEAEIKWLNENMGFEDRRSY